MEHRIQTPCGVVQGTPGETPGVSVYRGIRYAAAPPFGRARITEHWEGVYDATGFGPACWQRRAFYPEPLSPDKALVYREFREGLHFTYGEDCLRLNVYTGEGLRNAPVLLYLFGGAFQNGSSDERAFDGEAYVRRGIVVVTVNYRVGPWGFFALPELGEKGESAPGNNALWDQFTALQWVSRNIAAFGGDPGRITVMGQSAGAICTHLLSLSPKTAGMIQGAILLSGTANMKVFGRGFGTLEETFPVWRQMMRALGVSTLAELRTLPPKVIQDACREEVLPGYTAASMPALDGHLIPEDPAAAVEAGHVPDIPFLVTMTRDDMLLPMLHEALEDMAGACAAPGRQHRCWLEYFARELPGDDSGCWHACDLWYVFGSLGRGWRPFTSWDYQLADRLVDYYASFVRSGSPGTAGGCAWTPWTPEDPRWMTITNEDCTMAPHNLEESQAAFRRQYPSLG